MSRTEKFRLFGGTHVTCISILKYLSTTALPELTSSKFIFILGVGNSVPTMPGQESTGRFYSDLDEVE